MKAARLFTLCTLLPLGALAQTEEREGQRLDFGGLPLVSYDSEFGTGLGLNAALFFREPGYAPYRYALTLQGFYMFGGIQSHYVSLDAPRFMGSRFRPQLFAGYYREAFRPYYGVGNEVLAPPTDDPKYYSADQRGWGLQGWLEWQFADQWRLAGGYGLRLSRIILPPGSLLDQTRPTGSEGGRIGLASVELVHDTRDKESSPTRGVRAAVAVRGSHPALGSQFQYLGAGLVVSGYKSFFDEPYLVLATRFAADALLGDVPFTELSSFGTRSGVSGLGGPSSIRGLPSYRYVGKAKVLANVELRSRAYRFRPGEHTLDTWVVLFGEAGRVWADYRPDGKLFHLHGAFGLGLRLAWEEDYILRLDAGVSPEGGLGVYMDFGQLF